jgi:hypothetical protein
MLHSANRGATFTGMTVVYRPLRPLKRKRAQPAKIVLPGPAIVTSRKRLRYDALPVTADDAERDARISAFFAKMGLVWPVKE